MSSATSLTDKQKEAINQLCARIVDERDPEVFEQLCLELNLMLKKFLGIT